MPAFMPSQRPAYVFADEGRGMVRACTQRLDHVARSGRVAQADGEVAQPALVADAPDGRALQAPVELGLGPREQLHERSAVEAVARLEVLLGARPGEAVPRTDELAVVAAVYAVADEGAQLFRDRALVLDREIRDAAARVELVGAADRPGRAHIDAALATAAAVFLWKIDRQIQIAIDLPDEEPRSGLP